jgi:hypothetical protein
MPDTGTEPAAPEHAVIELRGELGLTDAAAIGAILSAAMAREPVIEVDLTPRHPWADPAGDHPMWVMRWTV